MFARVLGVVAVLLISVVSFGEDGSYRRDVLRRCLGVQVQRMDLVPYLKA